MFYKKEFYPYVISESLVLVLGVVFWGVIEIGSLYLALAVLKLAVETSLARNSSSAYLCPPEF